ncbi:GGDEF domain-containing protein [Nocardia suismassiliense]|uniref:GGDEF domain-containing protein n=1 Tax=Nocardia suismassiliense TaxID=2077092 RepID=UPI000D1F5728|nr:GGDEF domain-containing protein [Nocardia suismassiliense]
MELILLRLVVAVANGRVMLEAWWHDPADYNWLARALDSHAAVRWTKVAVGMGGAVLAGIAILVLSSETGPPSRLGQALDWLVVAFALFWALRWWLRPWPSRTESLTLFAAADLAITVACWQEADRVYGALGLVLLVVTGGYLAVMHNAKVLAVHAAWTVVSVVALTTRMVAVGGDPMVGLAIVLISVAAGVVLLPSMQFCYWVLRQDAVTDQLTALLNRRGLELNLSTLRQSGRSAPACAIAIDLDRFKDINDRFGHAMGDVVLSRTAKRLRRAVGSRLLLARMGGEEFVIFGPLDTLTARSVAELVRQAVAESDEAVAAAGLDPESVVVTASVGVAVFDGIGDAPTPAYLLACADTAMYQAKQLGGNLVVVDDLVGSSTA